MTPAYQEILKKHGKLPSNQNDEKKDENKNQENNPSINIVDSIIDDKNPTNNQETRLLTYNQMLAHLKSGDCAKQKIYTCPLKCEPKYTDKKMSYTEYIDHIKKECKSVLIKCTRCGEVKERRSYRNH